MYHDDPIQGRHDMPDIAEIWAFISSVFWTHLVPLLLTTGVPPLIEQAYKKFSGKDLPFHFHVKWTLAFGVVIAMFLTWQDAYHEAQSLRKNPIVTKERDRLCEQTVSFIMTPQPSPDKPYRQIMTISKPPTILYKFLIVSTSHIRPLLSGDMSIYQAWKTDDHLEPVTEVTVRSGINAEYILTIDSDEPFKVQCVGRNY